MKRQIIALLAAGGVLFAACGSDSDASSTTAADSTAAPTTASTGGSDAKACAEGKTLAAGGLTIATGDPAFPPYVIDDKPEDGQGFEAALALAVAKELGFEGDTVKWVRTSFDTAVAGSDSNFDFNLQQFTINSDRQKVVSFSDPYYKANQALIGYIDGPGANVKSIADLKSLKLGAAAGTTSLNYITDVIKPDVEPFAFNSNADATCPPPSSGRPLAARTAASTTPRCSASSRWATRVATSGASCSPRTTRWSTASTSRWRI
jgi:polar amino acid transport system substrate-binding protein